MRSVNLLPTLASERFRRQRLLLSWSKFLLCALLASAGLVTWGQAVAKQQLLRRDEQEALAAYPRQIRKQCAALQVQLGELNQYQDAQVLQRSRFSPLVAFQMLHQLKTQMHGLLQITNFEFVDNSPAKPLEQAATEGGYLSLQLISSGPASCSQLMQHLRETSYFSQVRLSSALEKVDGVGSNLQYSIRCEF